MPSTPAVSVRLAFFLTYSFPVCFNLFPTIIPFLNLLSEHTLLLNDQLSNETNITLANTSWKCSRLGRHTIIARLSHH